ncbi:Gmad2 immunoglobulin-like domain-containing protein [Nocardioides insulae]|uniref:Gmad2 immunoglobulin-like domain-containing protein n=1 Tax=Nocardioides insulae TaxID=394734 RepID=UPI00056A47BC|nr:Gmad2 immunoglobulin-like domain-containing protein [Nocardioides insulae]
MSVETPSKRRLALALLAAGATLTACGGDPSTAEDTPGASPTSQAPGQAGSATPRETPSDSPGETQAPTETSASSTAPTGAASSGSAAADDDATPGAATAPIYYVGDTPMGPRLYREFQVVGGGDVAASALDALANGVPTDPDYSTLVPPGEVLSVQQRGGRIRIVVAKDSVWPERGTLTPKQARLAAQSVVYTVQGALGTRRPVEVIVRGAATPTTLFGFDTSGGLSAAPELKVLSLVNITSPAQGQSVPASTITAEGRASSFEATVPWEVQDDSGKVVARGSGTAEGWMGRLYPWTVRVDLGRLDPGTYTFIARTDDPTGGQEGPGPFEDSKTITVR